MMQSCRWSLCLVGGLAVGLVGCASSRINTRRASLPPSGVEKTASTEHMLRVADILERQQKTDHAREIYREILKREPGHPVASARLNPPGVANAALPASRPVNGRSGPAASNRLAEFQPDRAAAFPDAAKIGPSTQVDEKSADEDVPVLKASPFDTLPTPPAPRRLKKGPQVPDPAVKLAEPVDKPELAPKLKRFSVSSELRTTKVTDPEAVFPELDKTPKPATRSVSRTEATTAASEPPSLRIMPRSKSGKRPPLKLRTKPAAEVSSNELDGMIAGLMHQKSNTRAVAAFSLGRLGTSARAAVPHLERALRNEKSGPVQVRLAEAIARIDAQNTLAFAMILDALQSADFKTRWEALCAADVANRGTLKTRRDTVRELAGLLQDIHPKMRSMAALKLSEFGSAAVPALPALAEAAHRGDTQLRTAASAALAVLQPGVLPPAREE